MLVDIEVDKLDFDQFFLNQHGNGAYLTAHRFQRGGRQSGEGIGSIFKSLWTLLFPLASNFGKSIGRSIGSEALRTGADIATDLLQGNAPVESVTTRGKQAVGRLLSKAGTKLQTGMARRVKRSKRPKKAPKRKRKVSKKKKTVKRRLLVDTDILGTIKR